MRPLRLLPIIGGVLLTISVLSGCGSTRESEESASTTTRSFSYETQMYRVEIEQSERNGECISREALFTTLNRLYTEPHVDRVRARDIGCDANDVTDFEEFEILRAPDQQERYVNNSAFRSRVNEDLWDAYQSALFNAT